MRGKFITFEGIEGCGKSTQARKLHQFFLSQKIDAILTREPGGTETGQRIREILLDENLPKLNAKTELFLHFASRIENIENLIKPAITNGKIVICDRFVDSSYVYQGDGLGLDYSMIDDVRKNSIGDLKPDITFLIDLPVETAFARIHNRSENNRYERLGIDFHQKIRNGFLRLANKNSRIKVINGDRNLDEVFAEILACANY